MPVQFSLEPDKPPVIFRFDVKSAQALEEAGGASPMYLSANGKQVTAAVLMLQFARLHDDPTMNFAKSTRSVQRYLTGGGKIKALIDALVKALNESGVYGDPEDAELAGEDDTAADPT